MQSTDTTKSAASVAASATSLGQLINFTIQLIGEHGSTQIRLSHTFTEKLIKELDALPEKSEYIKTQIQQLKNISELIAKTDLNDPNDLLVQERLSLLDIVAQLFLDLNGIAKTDSPTCEIAIFKNALDKADLQALFKSVDELVESTVQKFTVTFDEFWSPLGVDERKAFHNLNDWSDKFQAASLEGKFRNIIKLYEMFNCYLNK